MSDTKGESTSIFEVDPDDEMKEEYMDVVKEVEMISEANKDAELEEISSYEALLKRKEVEEKKKELDRLVNIISNRANALLAQSGHEKAEDKLGKTSDFYFDVINKVKGEPDKFLGGDVVKQHKLFELFVSTDLPNPRAVEHILSDIEGILRSRI